MTTIKRKNFEKPKIKIEDLFEGVWFYFKNNSDFIYLVTAVNSDLSVMEFETSFIPTPQIFTKDFIQQKLNDIEIISDDNIVIEINND